MARLVSIVVIYSADVDFVDVVNTLEREFMAKIDVGEHERMGIHNRDARA